MLTSLIVFVLFAMALVHALGVERNHLKLSDATLIKMRPGIDIFRYQRRAFIGAALAFAIFTFLAIAIRSAIFEVIAPLFSPLVAVAYLGLLLALAPIVYLLVSRPFKGVLDGTRKSITAFCHLCLAMIAGAIWLFHITTVAHGILFRGAELDLSLFYLTILAIVAAIAIGVASPLSGWLTNARRFRGREGSVLAVILGLVVLSNLWPSLPSFSQQADRPVVCTVKGAIAVLDDGDSAEIMKWDSQCTPDLTTEDREAIQVEIKKRGGVERILNRR